MYPTYIVYWRDGKWSLLQGGSLSHALTEAGYGHGALAALDFYEERETPSYKWNKDSREWEKAEGK